MARKESGVILFLDFDGVLHPAEVFNTRTQGIVLMADGHNLLEHAELLADVLRPYPELQIVLSTSWVPTVGFDKACARLPESLRARVVGSTWDEDYDLECWNKRSRYEQIAFHAEHCKLEDWLAIDDDNWRWPEAMRDRLVLTNEWGGLGGTKGAVDDLRAKLGAMGK